MRINFAKHVKSVCTVIFMEYTWIVVARIPTPRQASPMAKASPNQPAAYMSRESGSNCLVVVRRAYAVSCFCSVKRFKSANTNLAQIFQ